MSPAELKSMLQVLQDANVGEYSCAEFSVRFGGPTPPTETADTTHYPKEEARSLWHAKSLWADGKPPEFQAIKKEKRG